jgi:hypothetical protein
VPARSHSVGGSLSPSRAIRPQIQIGKPSLPEHGAIASQAGDGDGERLLQTSKTGEGRAPVRSAELEPGDGGTAAVPADDLPGEGVGLDRPGDSQLITSRPNNAEGIPTRACGPASGGAGSAWMPVTAGCRLSAHADKSDPTWALAEDGWPCSRFPLAANERATEQPTLPEREPSNPLAPTRMPCSSRSSAWILGEPSVAEGAKVEYEVEDNPKGPQARAVSVVSV